MTWDLLRHELTASFGAVPAPVTAFRLLAAVILGGLIGAERELQRKPAGLRTHVLVSMAACLFILVGQELGDVAFGAEVRKQIDPLRLIQAVTAGVAFLGAGTIISSQGHSHGLTTGASMWLAGAIGLACGAGHVPLAAMAAVIVLLILIVLRWIEIWMGSR